MARRGFSLVELLVVLLIVGILLAVVVGVIQSARAQSDATRCLSNLRQWGVALAQYTVDHDGRIPRRGQGVRPVVQLDRPDDWFNALPPYLGLPSYSTMAGEGIRLKAGQNSLFVCPSAKDTGGTAFLPYSMNMYLSPWNRPDQHRMAEIPNVSQLVFLADGPCAYSSTLPSRLAYSVQARHSDRVNLLFLDGHTASFTGEYVGANLGDPHRDDIWWETQTFGINQAPLP